MNENKLPLKIDQGKRLMIIRKHLDLSRNAFGAKFGMTEADIKNRESGLVEIKQIFATAVEKELSMSGSWLLTGKGQMLLSSNPTSSQYETSSENVVNILGIKEQVNGINSDTAHRFSEKAYHILMSGTGYAGLLKESIVWFEKAVDDNQKVKMQEGHFPKAEE